MRESKSILLPVGIVADRLGGLPDESCQISQDDGDVIGEISELGDALYVVQAVNCHADLLEACNKTLDWLHSFSLPPISCIEEKQEAMQWLEAAIAKAEGRSR